MKKKHQFPVIEIFGPTIQGEGPSAGRIVSFVRLAFCDFSCPMCDTKYSWQQPEFYKMTAVEIWDRLRDVYSFGNDAPLHVVISGGNPAMHPHLGELLDVAADSPTSWSCETQGSIYNEWLDRLDHLVVSPKVSSQKQDQTLVSFEQFLLNFDREFLEENVTIKVVVFDNNDIQDAFDYFNIGHRNGVKTFYFSIGTREHDDNKSIIDRYEKIINLVLQQQIRMSHLNVVGILPQIHTLVWGRKRGV